MSDKKLKIAGTKTEKLLLQSYFAESAAYSRYKFYAKQATKEEYFPIAAVFDETAENELHHAKVYFKYLPGGKPLAVDVMTHPGIIGDTAANLKLSAEEELYEGVEFYTNAAKIAHSEGFVEIASHFETIAEIEKLHHERFMCYLKHLENGTLWKRDSKVTWQCLVCGYQSIGTEPPKECPACDHPYQHYIALEDLTI